MTGLATVLDLSSDWLGYVGLAVVGIAIVVLLVSTFHPEGRRRPGGYLDGRGSRTDDDADRDDA